MFYPRSRIYLQKSLRTLEKFSKENGLTINTAKTVAMKFGSGGPPAAGDVFVLDGQRIEMVSEFCYLGITLTRRGFCFSKHIADRISRAKRAFRSIPKPWELSLPTAIALFELKIAPIASYGIQIIWEHLSEVQLDLFDKLKATYLKRVLGVHRSSRNRLVYKMADTPLFTEELQRRFDLVHTEPFRKHLEAWTEKLNRIPGRFWETPALKSRGWTGPMYKQRQRVTRGSIHGYHHLICTRDRYHDTDDSCTCKLCGLLCEEYHLYSCPAKGKFDWSKT